MIFSCKEMSGEEEGQLPQQFMEKLRSRFNALDLAKTGALDRDQLSSMIDENIASPEAIYEQMDKDEEGTP